MLLTDKGLQLEAFDTTMVSLLGNDPGEPCANLVVEAGKHQHARIELWDWLYLLLRAPMKTAAHTEFIDTLGMNVATFIDSIEAAFDIDEGQKGVPPADLLPTTVSPAVLQMLDRAEVLATENKCPNISELEVTLALFENAGDDMTEFFADVMDREKDGLGRFKKALSRKIRDRGVGIKAIEPFASDAPYKLRQDIFSSDGDRFCKRWREDMAAIGIKTKVTTRHLLYSILGNSAGPLANALSTHGVAVKDLHAALTRELTRPGRKRNDDFQLTKDAVFDSVSAVLVEAFTLSRERGVEAIGEIDIHRAFLAKQQREVQRLLRDDNVDLAGVADNLAEMQPEEEEAAPLQRFTLQEMQDRINKTIFGQEAAVARITPWISRFRFGIVRDGRPAGVFLFLGPTGTGKTQLGKELARYVYGNEEEMLFFEMGQFATRESMNQFIGSPPGYIGYGEGKLTNGLRAHPECVVLFDEIEKADTSVFDALLRFADEGRISDPAGPVRDGRRCIIVLTSNAGQSWLREHVMANPESLETPDMLAGQLFEEAMKELAAAGFRPEFLGRLDERITFLPFSMKTCRKIVDGVLEKELPKFEEKGVTVVVPDDVRDILAKFTFETAMDQGARGAPRAVNTHVISPIIDLLTPIRERGEPLPPKVTGLSLGVDGQTADGKSGIMWEIEQ